MKSRASGAPGQEGDQCHYSLHLNDYVPNEFSVSTLIESKGSLVVECSIYWDSNETCAAYEMMGGNSANGVQR